VVNKSLCPSRTARVEQMLCTDLPKVSKRHAEHLWLNSDRYHSSENYDTYEWF